VSTLFAFLKASAQFHNNLIRLKFIPKYFR